MNKNTRDTACDLFGGKDALAARILNALTEENSFNEQLLRGEDPVAAVGQFTRKQLLDQFFRCGIGLDDVLKPEWTAARKRKWLKVMDSRGPTVTMGSNGKSAPQALMLETFVQFEALSEICKPAPPKKSLQPTERVVELRKRISQVSCPEPS